MNAQASTDFPIRLTGVSKSFGDLHVLSALDLAVPRGTTFVIMGMSGTGKSVALKIMSGLLAPDAGSVVISGVAVEGASREDLRGVRARLGFLFQSAALIKWMTAAENVALPLLESGMRRRDARDRVMAKLEEVGLADSADVYPDALSGGMRKRVGFARATVLDPEIILYDEPTTGLDPITKRTIDDLIVRARDRTGATGVVVSHDLRSAVRVGDTIGLLYEGRMQVVASPEEFLRSDHEVARQFVKDGAPAVKRPGSKGP